MAKKSKRGGWRENAGRNPIYGVPMRKVTIMLDPETIEKAKKLGDGELSAGLRKAVKEFQVLPPSK